MSSIILLCACGFFVQALLNASKKYSLRYKTGMAFVYNSLLWGLAAFVGTIVTIKSFSWLLRLFSKLEIPWLCITVEFIRESFDLVWGFLDLIKFLPEPDKYLTLYKYFVLSFFFALPFSRIYVSKWFSLIIVVIRTWFNKGTIAAWNDFWHYRKNYEDLYILPNDRLMAKLIELVDEFVQITLNSNKVYVGVLAEADLGGSTPYNERLITIKPLVSGYRHQETLEFVETTNYEEIETFGIRQNFFLKDIVSFTKMIPEVDEYFTGKTRIKNLLLSETKTISGIEPSAFYDADLVEALREEDTLKDHIAKAILKNDQS